MLLLNKPKTHYLRKTVTVSHILGQFLQSNYSHILVDIWIVSTVYPYAEFIHIYKSGFKYNFICIPAVHLDTVRVVTLFLISSSEFLHKDHFFIHIVI